MNVPDFSGIASLLGDSGRARMLTYIMNNGVATASELSRCADLSAQATSNHLSKLVHGKVLLCEKQGRFRYYRIYDSKTAHVIESLIVSAYGRHLEKNTFNKNGIESLCFARTCYDHMAGKLGVSIFSGLINKKYVFMNNNEIEISSIGESWFKDKIKIKNSDVSSKRIYISLCMDWSERSYHISGVVGSEMCSFFKKNKFVLSDSESRSLHLTQSGKIFLKQELDIYL